jgi:phage terminase Nu1 subunit (DNA packaging protein)
MPRKAIPIKRDEVLAQKELAARLDLDPRQIRNLEKKGLPRTYFREEGEERGYPWPACLHWYVAFKIETETQKLSTPQRFQAAQIRELEAKAAKAELSLAQVRGELLDRPLVARERQQAFERIRNVNTTRASRWAPQLDGLTGTILLAKLEDLAQDEMAMLQRSLLSIPTYEEALRDSVSDDDGDDDPSGES